MKKYKAYATVDYAGFWIRLAAFLIDAIILLPIIWVFNGLLSLGFGLGWMGGNVDPLMPRGAVSGVFYLLGILIPFLIILAYLFGFWGWRGQTPGKMALRLKITERDGSDIDWGTAITRLLGYILSFLIVLIGYIWIGFDTNRQGLHDKIADTYVIILPRK